MINFLKPRYRQFFQQDLQQNLHKRYSSRGLEPSKTQLAKECAMYATDMCITFQEKSDGLLTSDWIEHITKETGAAINLIYNNGLAYSDIATAVESVKKLMRNQAMAELEVKHYYHRI